VAGRASGDGWVQFDIVHRHGSGPIPNLALPLKGRESLVISDALVSPACIEYMEDRPPRSGIQAKSRAESVAARQAYEPEC